MSYSTENNIMLYLTGKQTAGDVSVEELKAIADKYPAFGVAKFLLAKEAARQHHADAAAFAHDAILHFPDPYWFHFKLNEESLMEDEAILAEMKPVLNVEEASLPAGDTKPAAGDTNDYLEQEEAAVAQELENMQPGVEDQVLGSEGEPAQVDETDTAPVVSAGHIPVDKDDIVPAVSLEDVPVDRDDIVPAVSPEDVPVDKDDIVPAVSLEDVPVDKDDVVAAVSLEDVPIDKDDIVAAISVEEQFVQPALVEIGHDEHPQEETPSLPVATPGATLTEDIDNEQFEDADAENEAHIADAPFNDKISSVLKDQLQEFNKPVAEDAPVPIETEPYHTVDYFASQGIKLSLELQKQDNLGVKVKKFTDWLKQMKRVSPAPADLGIDEAAENKVQDIAATSNKTKEVVTEAMAEVLAMQGMKDKAIQVYTKLSFLDPSKSAYFASKIENLKGL